MSWCLGVCIHIHLLDRNEKKELAVCQISKIIQIKDKNYFYAHVLNHNMRNIHETCQKIIHNPSIRLCMSDFKNNTNKG